MRPLRRAYFAVYRLLKYVERRGRRPSTVLEQAQAQRGKPYVWGGE